MPTSIAGMDFKWHFSQNEYAQVAIEAIIESFGEAFVAPYAAELQPIDAMIFNTESLLQFDLPAGMSMKPYAELAKTESIGSAINSLMQGLAPIMSAYGFLMPIFQVIIGIMEVLCALMNPFAVKRAIKKLFKKYIPKLVAMFPFLAGVVIILNIIKMILAVIIFFMTVVLPMILLIINNAKIVNEAIRSAAAGNFNSDKANAGKEKIEALIIEMMNQMGALKAFLPLLEMIMVILGLKLKFPCKKAKGDDGCCDDDVCPPIIINPPKGQATLSRELFEEDDASIKYNIIIIKSNVYQLKKYNKSSKQPSGLSVGECCPAGTESEDCPNFSMKISNGRGQSNEILAPIIEIRGNKIISTVSVYGGSDLAKFRGPINFEIVPNFDMLVARQVISIGCHPEIKEEKDAVEALFAGLESPVLDYPEVNDFMGKCMSVSGALDVHFNNLLDWSGRTPYDINRIEQIQRDMMTLLQDFSNDLKGRLRGLADKTTNINNSTILVDKGIVRANATDLAVISVTPIDESGVAILRNFPDDTIPNVEIYSTVGFLSNKRFDKSAGSVLADLKSPLTGTAEITAKINSDFISDKIDGINIIRKVNVRFVADSTLPARRKMPVILDKQPKRG